MAKQFENRTCPIQENERGLTFDDWRLIEFYEDAREQLRHVRVLDAQKETYRIMLDLPSLVALLHLYGIPKARWRHYHDVVGTLFNVEHGEGWIDDSPDTPSKPDDEYM